MWCTIVSLCQCVVFGLRAYKLVDFRFFFHKKGKQIAGGGLGRVLGSVVVSCECCCFLLLVVLLFKLWALKAKNNTAINHWSMKYIPN